MMKNGYEIRFKDNSCLISDTHGLEIARLKMNGNSFYVKLDAGEGHASTAQIDKSVICHKSFRHHNLNSLMMLHDNVLVEGNSSSKIGILEDEDGNVQS